MIPIKKQVTSLVKIKLVPGKNGRDLTDASLPREQQTVGSGTGQCETTPAQERSPEAAHSHDALTSAIRLHRPGSLTQRLPWFPTPL